MVEVGASVVATLTAAPIRTNRCLVTCTQEKGTHLRPTVVVEASMSHGAATKIIEEMTVVTLIQQIRRMVSLEQRLALIHSSDISWS